MAGRPTRPDSLPRRVGEFLARHARPGASLCVAFSGGLDSSVLLDILAGLRDEHGHALSALHVHHGLSPDADRWAAWCEAFAAHRSVSCRVERVAVDRQSGQGVEAAARAARYEAFRRVGADFLVLAHHRDDQAETVLLQALRGTGMRGLAAMAARSEAPAIVHLRPLLDEPREALLAHAQSAGLSWIEDESNARVDFRRNFLRHEVLPRLAGHFPQARESLARLALHAGAAQSLLDELGREDLSRATDGDGLVAGRLSALSPQRQANALRAFLVASGLPLPSTARLAEMARQLFSARPDARVLLPLAGRALSRHRGRVMVVSPPGAPWQVPWRGELALRFGRGIGEVRFESAPGRGIAVARVAAEGWRFACRSGGERIRLRAGGPSRTLKNLLRESAVPAWRRPSLPLLFHGDELVWVPGIGIAEAYRAAGMSPGLDPMLLPEGGSEPTPGG